MTDNPFVQERPAAQPQVCLGVVASTENGLYIKVEGEAAARQSSHKRLAAYAPAVGDRVLLARISGTFVVLGKVV